MNEKLSGFLINLVLLGRPLLRGLGVDPYQLKVILQTKCMVDDRRPRGLGMYKNTSRRLPGWLKNLGFLFLGLLLSFTLLIGNSLIAQAIYLTAAMIYACGMLITDFSTVLIDVRDHYFIVSRPVNDKTVAAARLFHVLIYLGKIFVPLFIPAVIIVFLIGGVFSGLIFLVELASATAFSIFAVNIIYMLLMQFMKPQKFRDLIAYFQMSLNILIFAGYIIFPQFIQLKTLQQINPLDYTISYFFPPVWIASLQNWAAGSAHQLTYIFTVLALGLPILGLAAIVNFLSGDFNAKLSLMGSTSTSEKPKAEKKAHGGTFVDRLAPLFTTSTLDALGFKITWKLTSRMNKFKSRVYPSFAFILIYFFYWAFIVNGNKRSFTEIWQHLPQTAFYLFLLYAIGYVSIVIIMHITLSEKFKAAWFYQISPAQKPGLVLSGMIKSVFVKYLLPATIIAIIFILCIWGLDKWLNIIFAFLNILLITVVIAHLKARKFPFSEPANLEQQRGKRFLNIFLIAIPLGLGFFQSFISGYTLVLIILSVVYAIITWALFRVYKNISWDEMLGGK